MFEKVQNMICDRLGLAPEKVTMDSDFFQDLCCDSLDVVDLMTTAEEEFGMEPIPEEDLGKMQTVGDLVHYVENR